MDTPFDAAAAQRILNIVDRGLSVGLRDGGMVCVEAAVCAALGLPHGDDPGCVLPALRKLKIQVNDRGFNSPETRARALRRLAVAQVGSDSLDEMAFVRELVVLARDFLVRNTERYNLTSFERAHLYALREATLDSDQDFKHLVELCYRDNPLVGAYSLGRAASLLLFKSPITCANNVVEVVLSCGTQAETHDFCEEVVQLLVRLDAPGCAFLDRCPFQPYREN